MSDYFAERDRENFLRLSKLIEQLPPFCEEFFLGIKTQTTTLTRLNYAYDLRIFFDFIVRHIREFNGKNFDNMVIGDLGLITVTHIEKFLDYLTYYEFDGGNYACDLRAKSRKLSSVRSFFKYFFNKEKISANTAAKITMPKLHDKEIVRLEVDEVVRILNSADSGEGLTGAQAGFHKHTRLRDAALLTLLLGTGIRVSECVGLNLDDIDFSANSFLVTRKGGNKVILYFSDEVAAALKAYIAERSGNQAVDKSERALFLSLQNRRISVRAVELLVKKYSRIVTPLKKITPHKLRSTYGTALYRETQDIYVVADVLGHKDVNTTKKHYAAISDEIRRSAASKVKLRD